MTNMSKSKGEEKLQRDYLVAERNERDKLTVRYVNENYVWKGGFDWLMIKSQEQIYSEGYDQGYTNGYRCGLEDGWAKGFDAGVEWQAAEKMGGVVES
jgi:hypothetical protein